MTTSAATHRVMGTRRSKVSAVRMVLTVLLQLPSSSSLEPPMMSMGLGELALFSIIVFFFFLLLRILFLVIRVHWLYASIIKSHLMGSHGLVRKLVEVAFNVIKTSERISM